MTDDQKPRAAEDQPTTRQIRHARLPPEALAQPVSHFTQPAGAERCRMVALVRNHRVVFCDLTEKAPSEITVGYTTAPKAHREPGYCSRDRGGNRQGKAPERMRARRPRLRSVSLRKRLGNLLVLRLLKHVADERPRLP